MPRRCRRPRHPGQVVVTARGAMRGLRARSLEDRMLIFQLQQWSPYPDGSGRDDSNQEPPSRLMTQAQRTGAPDATIANREAMAVRKHPGSLQRMVSRHHAAPLVA